MGRVVKHEDAIWAIGVALSEAAGDIQVAVDVLSQNAGGLLFGAWSGGVVPAESAYDLLTLYDCLGIGMAACGYGVPGVRAQGRKGIWLRPYMGMDQQHRAILLEWSLQKKGRIQHALDYALLSQKKARQKAIAIVNGEENRLLLRVPHK